MIVAGVGRRLARFDADGELDTSFADDGWARSSLAVGGVAVQADGAIVLTGPRRRDPWSFTVARFDGAGERDPSFGGDGVAEASLPGFDNATYGVTIQADGKIVVVGTTSDVNIDGRFALARFLAR